MISINMIDLPLFHIVYVLPIPRTAQSIIAPFDASNFLAGEEREVLMILFDLALAWSVPDSNSAFAQWIQQRCRGLFGSKK